MRSVTLTPASAPTPELVSLWDEALHDAGATRGALALLENVGEGVDLDDLLAYLIDDGRVWGASSDGQLQCFVVLERRVIQALYVGVAHRRHGMARAVLEALNAMSEPPVDAWALPGDRATKSLYESIGWKARLLTMRAE